MSNKWDRWEAELASYRLRLRQEQLTWEKRKLLQDHCRRLELVLDAQRGTYSPVPHPELKRNVRTKRVHVPLGPQARKKKLVKRKGYETMLAHLTMDGRLAGLRRMLAKERSPRQRKEIGGRIARLEKYARSAPNGR